MFPSPSRLIPLLLLLLLLLASCIAIPYPSDDPHDTLGVSSDASPLEIKRAYMKKALLYHPDKQTNASPQAAKRACIKMRKINAAYATPPLWPSH